jgi:phosphopantetheinyl transferase
MFNRLNIGRSGDQLGEHPDIRAFVYAGPLTSQIGPDVAALRARLAPIRRERLDRLAGAEERAVQMSTLRLLEWAMRHCGLTEFRLEDVSYPEQRKPYWPGGDVDFSLSHTRGIALCAIGAGIQVGIDVEELTAVTPSIVARVSSSSASCLQAVTASNAATRWTQIEAIAKAAGLGVFRGTDIQWSPTVARLDGRSWYWRSIEVGSRYSAHIATNREAATIEVIHVTDLGSSVG